MEKIPNWGARLERALFQSGFGHSGMAVWFSRNPSTIRNWFNYGFQPSTAYRQEVWRRLELLENVLGSRVYPLLPYELRLQDRREYIKRVFHDADTVSNP